MLQPVVENNNYAASIKFMVTGALLLLAVTLDAYARSRREATGRV
jgi:hypothetical protein